MQNVLRHCAAILDRVVFIGFGVQIVLGMVWMCGAFAGLRLPGEGILCVAQLLFFVLAAFWFLKTASGMKVAGAVWGSLCLATFPMVAQCHMTVGRTSVTASVLLLEMTCALLLIRDSEKKIFWAGMLCSWILLGLFGRIYFCVGAVPILFSLGYLLENHTGRKLFLSRSVTAFLAACAILGAGVFCWGSNSFSSALINRFAWSSLEDAYWHMPDERKALLDWVELGHSTYEPTGIDGVLRPSLLETMDEPEAKAVLRELATLAWENNPKKIMKEILWDVLGYTVPTMVLPAQFEGRAYDSLSGRNYLQVLMPSPKLGKAYMEYGCRWFSTALAVSLILRILKWAQGVGSIRVRERLMILGICFVMVFLFTMSGAGVMDYTKTVFVLCMWLAWMWGAAGHGTCKNEKREGE